MEYTARPGTDPAFGTFFFIDDRCAETVLGNGAERAESNHGTGMVLGAVIFADLDHFKFLIISCFTTI
jgi:hypothetical protein